MKIYLFLFFYLFSISFSFAQKELQEFLNIDRFHVYIQRWSETVEKRKLDLNINSIKNLTPADLQKMKFPAKKLEDAFAYDDLIFEIIQKKFPKTTVKKKDIIWEYNFYKRKLNEAYIVADPGEFKPIESAILDLKQEGKKISVSAPKMDDILLNVDGYVSGRSTRGIFWEASKNQRPIELHVGSASDFKINLSERGGKIIGQIKTVERNYNPIYLIQLPGEKEYRYAVTEISGSDRLKHFALQSELVKWNDIKKTKAPNLKVFGDPKAFLLKEEEFLTKTLKVLPKADQVIIGHKNTIERTLKSLGKSQAVLNLAEKYPKEVNKVLNPVLRRALDKALENPEFLAPYSRDKMTLSEDLYDAVEPLFKKLDVRAAPEFIYFDLDRGIYKVSDYLLMGRDGKPQRWRLFSNSWGDEVLPMARALKNTGHTDVIYIGTAGALPDSGLEVGDLVIPKKAMDQNGKLYPINSSDLVPKNAKEVNAVINVASPFEEDKDWLGKAKKSSQVVEIETGYIAATFNAKNDKFQPFLLISDVVGLDGATLAEASSTQRQIAQHNVIRSILEKTEVIAPKTITFKESYKIAEWVEELLPERDIASKYQLIRKAALNGVQSKEGLKSFVNKEPSFTTSRLEDTLRQAGRSFDAIFDLEGSAGSRLFIDGNFLNGSWHPNEKIKVFVQAPDLQSAQKLDDAFDLLIKKDPKLAKIFTVEFGANLPHDASFISINSAPDDARELFLQLYKDSALGFGGLTSTETRSGGLKFIKVAPVQEGRAEGTLAFFEANDETTELMKGFKGKGKESFLKNQIAELNKAAGPNKPWEIKYTVVDELTHGSLAQIVPELSGKAENLTIHLRITKEGIKNPAVIMEELIHLEQITGAPVAWKTNTQFKSFFHPFHWAEVVANAQAGSFNAAEKLARLELEAAQASEDAAKFYLKEGVFAKEDSELVKQYIGSRTSHASDLYKNVAKEARAHMRKSVAAWEKSKEAFDKLEKQSVKLNDLVAKGDRKGVRKLVEAYLPWDIMEPSEKKAWTEWLEAMEFPDKKRTKIVFRGMYDDLVMRNKEGTPYLMSTVMTKNQGNYTRRLRSLGTLREKFGQQVIRDSFSSYNLTGAKNPTSITVMMGNHAIEALGSPFLSTASYDVATKFGPRQLGTFAIDERRLVLNAMSPDKYLYQHEMLTPLFIFPDEVVHFHDYARNPVEGVGPRSPEIRRKHYLAEVEKILKRPLTLEEIHGIGSEQDFMKTSYQKLKKMVLDKKTLPMTTGGCALDAKTCECLFGALNGLLK